MKIGSLLLRWRAAERVGLRELAKQIGISWPELCPVLWSIPGGFLVAMPRAEVCTDDNEPTDEEYERLIVHEEYEVPAERKAESWGYLNGRLVAIDYGL
jgi:hypothetical protein